MSRDERYAQRPSLARLGSADAGSEDVRKGIDWDGRLPAEETEICQALGIQIVFLDTVRDSSSRILDTYMEQREK